MHRGEGIVYFQHLWTNKKLIIISIFYAESETKDETESGSATPAQNSTDEEKLFIGSSGSVEERQAGFTLNRRYIISLDLQ